MSMLEALSEGGGGNAIEGARDAEAMSGDEDLLMERGNDLAPNNVCPLSMKQARLADFEQLLAALTFLSILCHICLEALSH